MARREHADAVQLSDRIQNGYCHRLLSDPPRCRCALGLPFNPGPLGLRTACAIFVVCVIDVRLSSADSAPVVPPHSTPPHRTTPPNRVRNCSTSTWARASGLYGSYLPAPAPRTRACCSSTRWTRWRPAAAPTTTRRRRGAAGGVGGGGRRKDGWAEGRVGMKELSCESSRTWRRRRRSRTGGDGDVRGRHRSNFRLGHQP